VEKEKTMRATFMLLSIITISAVSSAAFAQADCLTSLNVKADKSVTFLSFGPAAGDRVTKNMSCLSAESLRAAMFLSGQALKPDLLGSAIQLRAKIGDIRAKLAAAKTDLGNASTRAKREIVLQTLKLTLAAAGTAASATGCISSGTTCLVALGGVVTLYGLIESAATTAGDLAQQAAQARAEIAKILPVLQALEGQLNDNLAQQGKLRYNVAFTEMCRAIKQQCL
jgi:hypothetical protein